MDNDSFNQLTLSAGIPWRMVTVLRAYCRYLLQTGLPFSQGYIAQVLENNAPISRLLADLFSARFDPQLSAPLRARSLARLGRDILSALEEVTRSDEDRILRALWNALSATVRTNAFQPYASGQLKEYLSFKIGSQQLRELPLPKPLFEIFVFSPRMEGVHLRMGYVARGGIRWSDRREDPHRSIGIDEGTAGQEYRHCAGRREGRLRREAPARRARGTASRGDCLLSDADSRIAGCDRQHCR
jgi:glutamate dehydrogenase